MSEDDDTDGQVEGIEMTLTQYDVDHLREGQPVYKPLEDKLLVLRKELKQ